MVVDSVVYDVTEDYTLTVADVQKMPDKTEYSKKNTFAYGIAVVEFYNTFDELVYVIAHKDEDMNGLNFE